jgi:hypothetical protein
LRDTVRGRLAQRRRALPLSDRSIFLVSALIVLVAIPLWLDPQTLSDVLGRAESTAPPTTGPHLSTPRANGSTPGPSPAASAVAADDFQRSLSATWGSAEAGGAYTVTGTGVPSVRESTGFVQLAPGDAGSAVLGSLGVRDGVLDFQLSVDRLPLDGELVGYGLLRVVEGGSAYRTAVHVTAAGDVYIALERLSGGQVERLGSEVLISSVGSRLAALHVRAQAMGDDPTTLSMRAWLAGATEPTGWQLSTIDWTAALQRAGAVGLGWRLDAAQAQQLVVGFSDLAAWKLGVDE